MAEEWRAAGIEVVGPRDEEYGKREGSVTDPDGNLIRFGSPLQPTRCFVDRCPIDAEGDIWPTATYAPGGRYVALWTTALIRRPPQPSAAPPCGP